MKGKNLGWLVLLVVPLGLYGLWNCVIAFLLWKIGGHDVFLPGRVMGGTGASLIVVALAKILAKSSGALPRPSA